MFVVTKEELREFYGYAAWCLGRTSVFSPHALDEWNCLDAEVKEEWRLRGEDRAWWTSQRKAH